MFPSEDLLPFIRLVSIFMIFDSYATPIAVAGRGVINGKKIYGNVSG